MHANKISSSSQVDDVAVSLRQSFFLINLNCTFKALNDPTGFWMS